MVILQNNKVGADNLPEPPPNPPPSAEARCSNVCCLESSVNDGPFNDYLCRAYLCKFFGFYPCGLVAVYFSKMAKQAYDSGDLEKARSAARTSKRFSTSGFLIQGLLVLTLIVVLLVATHQ